MVSGAGRLTDFGWNSEKVPMQLPVVSMGNDGRTSPAREVEGNVEKIEKVRKRFCGK